MNFLLLIYSIISLIKPQEFNAASKLYKPEVCSCILDCNNFGSIVLGPCQDKIESVLFPPQGCSNFRITNSLPSNWYLVHGIYTVCVQATDDFGNLTSCCGNVEIFPWDYYYWFGIYTIDTNHLFLGTNFLASSSPIGCVWSEPVKICADGSDVTVVKFVNQLNIPNADIRFRTLSDQGMQNPDKYGEFPLTKYTYHGDTVVARYVHPKYITPSNGFNYVSDSILIGVVNTTGGLFGKFPIRIYRAPVVFVHGLYGDESTFNVMKNRFLNEKIYPKTSNSNSSPLLYQIDYKGTNSSSFITNRKQVNNGINIVLKHAREQKFSAGKVILIGHSMGGILGRLYLQNSWPEVKYRNDIAKMITLNTPHYGTQFANWSIDNLTIYDVIQSIITGNYDEYPYAPAAIYDLRVNSYPIRNKINILQLPQNIVPSVTLDTDAKPIPFTDLIVRALNLLLPQYIFNGEKNDLIVPKSSQKCGINSVQTLNGQWHVGSTTNNSLISNCINLIDANPTSNQYFSLTGFPVGELQPPNITYPNHPSRRNLTDYLNIEFPIENQSFQAGDIIKIQFSGQEDLQRIGLVIYGSSIQPISIDTNAVPFVYVTLPPLAIGQISILALGGDSLNWFSSDIVSINVNSTLVPDSFKISPKQISVPIGVTNYFSPTVYYSEQGINIAGTQDLGINYDTSFIKLNNNQSYIGKKVGITQIKFDYKGLLDSMVISIYNDPSVLVSAFNFSSSEICSNDSVHFTQSSIGLPVSFSWTFEGGIPAISNQAEPVITYPVPGNYSVGLTTTFTNGMDAIVIDSLMVVGEKPNVFITPAGEISFCNGDSVILAASEAKMYLWVNGDTSQLIIVKNTGNFTVQETAQNGCSNISQSVSVEVFPSPLDTITTSGSQVICSGDSLELISNSANSYQWNTGDTTQSIKISDSGTYQVTIIDALGCKGVSEPIDIGAIDPIIIHIQPSGPTEICSGDQITLTADFGNTFLWSTSDTTQSITINQSGSYTVTVSDINGCNGISQPVVVTVFDLPLVDLGPDTIDISEISELDAGPGWSNYIWNTGQVTQIISVAIPGWYSVTVTNGNNCSATDSIFVTQITNITNLSKPSPILIYPNPNSGHFIIAGEIQGSALLKLNVIDPVGKSIVKTSPIMVSGKFENSNDFGQLTVGIYFLLIELGDYREMRRISIIPN